MADTTDLAKYYARHLEGLGRVHDGSDPQQRIAPGYCVFEAYVRVGKWQLFPLEKFLVRTWLAISRLLVLVALAFWWLNLWGENHFTTLREALNHHPWRLKKAVIYLFDWFATMLTHLLLPAPY